MENTDFDNLALLRALQAPQNPMDPLRNQLVDAATPEWMQQRYRPVPPDVVAGKIPAVERGPQDLMALGGMDALSMLAPSGKAAAAGKAAGMTAQDLAALFLMPHYASARGGSYRIVDDAGKKVAMASLNWKPDKKQVYVDLVDHLENHGSLTRPETANVLGPKEMRSLLPEVKREFPNAETIGGMRISGAREKSRREADALLRIGDYEGYRNHPSFLATGNMEMPIRKVQPAPPVPDDIVNAYNGRYNESVRRPEPAAPQRTPHQAQQAVDDYIRMYEQSLTPIPPNGIPPEVMANVLRNMEHQLIPR